MSINQHLGSYQMELYKVSFFMNIAVRFILNSVDPFNIILKKCISYNNVILRKVKIPTLSYD